MGLKVLLADDETEYVDTLAERLELRDYSVRVVHDGISALTAVEEDMPDVVVLDLFMPGLPGNKVLAELNRRYPKLPVVLITGQTGENGCGDGPAQQAYTCLTKPVPFNEFLRVVGEAANSARDADGKDNKG